MRPSGGHRCAPHSHLWHHPRGLITASAPSGGVLCVFSSPVSSRISSLMSSCVRTHQSDLPGKPRVESKVVFTYQIREGGEVADHSPPFVDCCTSDATMKATIHQYARLAQHGALRKHGSEAPATNGHASNANESGTEPTASTRKRGCATRRLLAVVLDPSRRPLRRKPRIS